MEKMPLNNKKSKLGIATKVVTIGAGMLLPNAVDDTVSLESKFKEDEKMKIILTESKDTSDTSAKDTLYLNSIPNLIVKENEDEQDLHSTEKPISAEITPEKSEVNTVNTPAVVSEKETKRAETSPDTGVELDPHAFKEHVKVLLDSAMGKKVKLEELKIDGNGDSFTIEANIKGSGIEVGFKGNLESKNGELEMGKHEIKAGFLIRALAEKTLTSKVKTVLGQLKARLENTYKNTHPLGIEKLFIEKGNLKIIFKKKI